MLTPLSLLFGLFTGLLSLAIPLAGLALLLRTLRPAVRRVRRVVPISRDERQAQPEIQTVTTEHPLISAADLRKPAVLLPLLAGALLLLSPLFGRQLIQLGFPAGADEPRPLEGTSTYVTAPDGTRLHVELYGDANAPTLLLTHGWSTDNTEWYYAKRQLAGRFHLIIWDLPGSGASGEPADHDFTLERMASDLRAVLTLAGGRHVVLVGHSIGGMINLTFAKLYPELLGPEVAGIVEVDTSYTNPVRTTKNSDFSLALQKPVAEPILYAMIGLSPLVRAVDWLSYQEGIADLSNASSGFGGAETRGQVDLISRYGFETSPGVVARGTLAMFHWDTTPVLPRINVPVLILVGKEDTTTLPSASEFMSRTIPHAELKTVQPGAHYSLLEQNEAIDADIASFASVQLLKP